MNYYETKNLDVAKLQPLTVTRFMYNRAVEKAMRNNDILKPTGTDDWIYAYRPNCTRQSGIENTKQPDGKWLLFYPRTVIDHAWESVKELLNSNEIEVESAKCICNAKHAGAMGLGVIVLYCLDSKNKERILSVGRDILNRLNYTYRKTIYYKTDEKTRELQYSHLGCKNISLYKLDIQKRTYEYSLD